MRWWDARDLERPEAQTALAEAAALLRAGGLVAFPTETVYGLGADATNETAVRGIFAAKGRPADNPLIVHIARHAQLSTVVAPDAAIPESARRVMAELWPGPITLLLPAHPALAPAVHPELDTVGVRMPSHPVARRLLDLAGVPVAAPSANLSGRPSPTRAEDVAEDMAGRIDGIVDGGPCNVGVESTVALVTAHEAVIYRPGGVTPERLAEVAGVPVRLDAHLTDPAAAPRAPGMKYRHYAPRAQVRVWWGDETAAVMAIAAWTKAQPDAPCGVICPASAATAIARHASPARIWSPPPAEPYAQALARELYHLLREMDRAGMARIAVIGPEPDGAGLAVMNRLEKAAEGRVLRV
ncbi:MAG: threonylcarbamoyl-AMP synthase [Thermoflavifilum sp.]|nr:threonylcarbamoyl-AMP synthase [Thermoflavifilum sp.]MCL6513175.1 threonylcarbamoyl-AMP synthase [Alicyclobacillus sp.]